MKTDSVPLQQLLCSYLYYIEKKTCQEIADMYDVSLATVSRRLADAKKQGFIRKTCSIIPPEEFKDSFYKYVTFNAVSDRLKNRLNEKKAGIRRLIVVPGDRDPSQETPDTENNDWPRAQRVAYHAARLLAEQLTILRQKQGTVNIALNWGYNVQWVCKHFFDHCTDDLRTLPPEALTLSGLMGLFWVGCDSPAEVALARRSWEVSAAANVQLLANAFDAAREIPVRLIRAPALLSKDLLNRKGDLTPQTRKTLEIFFHADPGYYTLYGTKPICPTSEEAEQYLERRWKTQGKDVGQYGNILSQDILLTGMSALGDGGLVQFIKPELTFTAIRRFRDKDGACGDVANHIFTKDGYIPRIGDAEHKTLGALNSRVLSLWAEDLRDVAERHRENNSQEGGVILVSSGHEKAHPLYVALTKLHIANEVIIDSNMAYKLYDSLEIDEETRKMDFDAYCS